MNKRATIQHALIALVMLLATFAGVVTPSGEVSSPAAAQSSGATPIVWLFEAVAGSGGQSVSIANSMPDLSQTGWANRVSGLMVLGGMVIAAYSGPNYTGSCEPFIGHDPDLTNNRIGNDTIRSIKFFATCTQDPVTDAVVTDISVVTAEVSNVYCPPGDYVQKNQDLNEGVDGDYIYLCLKIGQKVGDVTNGNFVYRLEVVVSITPKTSDSWCLDTNTQTDAHFIATDLNAGAGGSYVYLCYWKADQDYLDHGVTSATGTFRDLAFATDDNPFLGDEEILSRCRYSLPDVVVGNVEPTLVERVRGSGTSGNLNDLAGTPALWMCALTYIDPISTPPDTTPPIITLTSRTPANAAGWNNTAVALSWSCTDDQSGPVAATVSQTLNAEGAGQSATGTCTDQAGNSLSDTQTGINIDLTAPTIGATAVELGAPPTAPPYTPGTWTNLDVKVTFLCSDALSGIAGGTGSVVVATEGAGQSAAGSCVDLADNVSDASFTGINIDKTAPVVTYDAHPATYLQGETVDIGCQATDALSGIALDCQGVDQPAHTFNLGQNTINTSATDLAGNVGHAATTFEILNVAPAVDAPALNPDPSNETEPISLTATFSDPGLQDTFNCTIDWGDGSPSAPGAIVGMSCEGTHTYLDDNPSGTSHDDYTITVKVCDNAGDYDDVSAAQTVRNLPPVIDSIMTAGGPYGQAVVVTAAAHDPASADDQLMYAFDCDDNGTFEVGPQASTRTTCIPSTTTLTPEIGVRVSDDDQGTAEDSVTLTLSRSFCVNMMSRQVFSGGYGCRAGERPMVLTTASQTTFCASVYTSLIFQYMQACPSGYMTYLVPAANSVPICVSNWDRSLRINLNGGCSPNYVGDVIPSL